MTGESLVIISYCRKVLLDICCVVDRLIMFIAMLVVPVTTYLIAKFLINSVASRPVY